LIGILENLRVKIFGEGEGYEPEIYITLPESQTGRFQTKSEANEKLPIEQNNMAVAIVKANNVTKKEKRENENKMRSFYMFGETGFNSCQHKFGFLGNCFENKPIPDECFGCYKIVECFNQTKKSKKKIKHTLSTTLYW